MIIKELLNKYYDEILNPTLDNYGFYSDLSIIKQGLMAAHTNEAIKNVLGFECIGCANRLKDVWNNLDEKDIAYCCGKPILYTLNRKFGSTLDLALIVLCQYALKNYTEQLTWTSKHSIMFYSSFWYNGLLELMKSSSIPTNTVDCIGQNLLTLISVDKVSKNVYAIVCVSREGKDYVVTCWGDDDECAALLQRVVALVDVELTYSVKSNCWWSPIIPVYCKVRKE